MEPNVFTNPNDTNEIVLAPFLTEEESPARDGLNSLMLEDISRDQNSNANVAIIPPLLSEKRGIKRALEIISPQESDNQRNSELKISEYKVDDITKKILYTTSAIHNSTLVDKGKDKIVEDGDDDLETEKELFKKYQTSLDEKRDSDIHEAYAEIMNNFSITDENGNSKIPDFSNLNDKIQLFNQRGYAVLNEHNGDDNVENMFKYMSESVRKFYLGTFTVTTKMSLNIPIQSVPFFELIEKNQSDYISMNANLLNMDFLIEIPLLLLCLVDSPFPHIITMTTFLNYCRAIRRFLSIGYQNRIFHNLQPSDSLKLIHTSDADINERSQLKNLGYPDWFDIGRGLIPDVPRKDVTDETLEDMAVSYANAFYYYNNTRLESSFVEFLKIKQQELLNNSENANLIYNEIYEENKKYMLRVATYDMVTILRMARRYVPVKYWQKLIEIKCAPVEVISNNLCDELKDKRILLMKSRKGFMEYDSMFQDDNDNNNLTQVNDIIVVPSSNGTDPSLPTISEMKLFLNFALYEPKNDEELISRIDNMTLTENAKENESGNPRMV